MDIIRKHDIYFFSSKKKMCDLWSKYKLGDNDISTAYLIFFPEKSDVIKKKYHESITAGHVFKYMKVSGTCPGLPYTQLIWSEILYW